MAYQFEPGEIAKALLDIVNTDVDCTNEKQIIVKTKDSADIISEIFFQAKVYGPVTGPYLQPINGSPTRVWYVEK